jgi:cytochrome c biogenesis protein CcdA/thiol-disulfide isomerase/thioredoxin
VVVLWLIGFLAGVVTAISPCVLPVLPIVLAGGATGGRRRPYAIIGGLVVSFAVFTLFATWILDQLGLPQDTLRNISIGMLFLLAATLVVPKLAALLERPFLFLTRRRSGDLGGGFVLGVSLGLVFVPCGGPVIGAVTAQAARLHFGVDTIVLTLFYALGAALPMLAIALGGRRVARRFRADGQRLRVAMGVVMALAALAILFDLDRKAQTAIGDYTSFLQKAEKTAYARNELRRLQRSGPANAFAANPTPHPQAVAGRTSSLPDLGNAPEFTGIQRWLNTPGGRPLTLAALRGKVVLVDFWTYSCINCLRTLPHLRAWDAMYRNDGLVIVGVHTPEFAFEHVQSNVRTAVRDLGVRYPVAIDNSFKTWDAYSNQYWPAEYLIDRAGHIRHTHFGEREYDVTERSIRSLLVEAGATLPGHETRVADRTPTDFLTPESYLGYGRLERYAGAQLHQDQEASYTFPYSIGQNSFAYSGRWRVEAQRIVAGRGARLRLSFQARRIHLVTGGVGAVQVLVDGKLLRTVHVRFGRLYTLASFPRAVDGLLELRFTPGVQAYAFTFS